MQGFQYPDHSAGCGGLVRASGEQAIRALAGQAGVSEQPSAAGSINPVCD